MLKNFGPREVRAPEEQQAKLFKWNFFSKTSSAKLLQRNFFSETSSAKLLHRNFFSETSLTKLFQWNFFSDLWRWLCRHGCWKLSAHVNGGLSGGSRVRRPRSKDPHRRKRNFFSSKKIPIVFSFTSVDLQMLARKFCSFQLFHYLPGR